MKIRVENNTQKLGTAEKTSEGFLNVDCAVARSGTYEYSLGSFTSQGIKAPTHLRGKPDNFPVKVLRPDDVVFGAKHLNSIPNKPITDDHPEGFVNSKNSKVLTRGHARDSISLNQSEGLVEARLCITDESLVTKVENKEATEVSTGEDIEADWEQGVDQHYGNYDVRVTDIKVNHLAIVKKGRAGSAVRLYNCEDKESSNQKGEKMKTVMINGVPVEVEDKTAPIIETLQKDAAKVAGEKAALAAELKNSVAEKAKLEGENAALKKQIDDPSRLEELAAERAEVVNAATSAVKDFEHKGKSLPEIKKEVVVALDNSTDYSKASPEFIEGAFGVLTSKTRQTENADSKNNDTLNGGYQNSDDSSEGEDENDPFIRLKNSEESFKKNKGRAPQA